jgi:CspA family cold shock protein
MSERTERNNGKIKWFNFEKGYGFIQANDDSTDVFLHVSALEKAGINSLKEGQAVSYEVSTERGKVAAANIQLV